MPTIAFRKMNGLGNDFAVLDGRAGSLGLTGDRVRQLADRDGPVGCDQVIVLEPSERADVFMRIYNRRWRRGGGLRQRRPLRRLPHGGRARQEGRHNRNRRPKS